MTQENKVAAEGSMESQETLERVNLLASSKLLEKLEKLQKELQTQLPGYEGTLHDIHRVLSEDEALVHILSPQQVGLIVSGLSKKKNLMIVEAAIKKTKTKKQPFSVDDI